MSDIDLGGLPNPASLAELAAWMRVGDDSVREPIKRGQLEAVRVNRRGDFRIFHDAVRRYLAGGSMTDVPPPPPPPPIPLPPPLPPPEALATEAPPKRPVGRPRVEASQAIRRVGKAFTVRLTVDELARVKGDAKRRGAPLSQYVRSRLGIDEPRENPAIQPALREPPEAVAVASPVSKADSWLRVDQAAEEAQVSPATIRRAISLGHLTAYRLSSGKRFRLRRSAVTEWLERAQAGGRA